MAGEPSHHPGHPSGGISVLALASDYVEFANGYYVKNGVKTPEAELIRLSLVALFELYGTILAAEFSPLKLKAVRQRMIDSERRTKYQRKPVKLCRSEINRRAGRIIRAFHWAAVNELIPVAVVHALKTVARLCKGRCDVKEAEPVKPVADSDIDATIPHVNRYVAAMIATPRLTGARPGEIVIMRTDDIDRSGLIGEHVMHSHKFDHGGQDRIIPIGPKGQAILAPFLDDENPGAYLFSPGRYSQELWDERWSNRKTPVQPSRRNRKWTKDKRAPGDH